MKKFGPRSRVGHFCNERTWSTPLHLNSCFGEFCSVRVHLRSFCYSTKHGAIWAELMQLVRKVRATKSFQNFSQQTHQVHPHGTINSCFSAFCGVWVHLGSFHYHTKLGANWAKGLQLVRKVHAMKLCGNFLQRTHPVHPIGHKTHVLVRFIVFGCTLDRFSLPHKIWCKLCWTGAVSAKVYTMKLRWNFSQWMHPVQPIGP